MPKDFNYELLFKTLIRDIPFQLVVRDGKIHVTADSFENIEAIKRALQQSLNSSQNLQETLKYSFTAGEVVAHPLPSQLTVTQIQPHIIPKPSAQAAQDLLNRLIGEERFENAAININGMFGKRASENEGVIFSHEIKDDNLAEAWRNNIEFLLRFFDNVTVEQIRNVLASPDQHLPEPAEQTVANKNQNYARGLLQECFGLQRFESPTRVIAYFNLKRFWQFTYPPEFESTNNNQSNFSFSLDEEHFIAYLKSLLQGSVLLKVFKDTDKKNYAMPIPLGLVPTARKQPSYCLIIDTSASMRTNEAHIKLKEQAIQFLTQLRDKCLQRNDSVNDSFVTLIFFDKDIRVTREMTLAQLSALISEIKNQTFEGDKTSLCGAIAAAFADIENRSLTMSRQHTVILFTDGLENVLAHDAVGEIREGILSNAISQIMTKFQRSGLPFPNFYTFGYGEPDRKLLQRISNFTANSYSELPDMDAFAAILESYSPQMSIQKEVVEILTSIGGDQSFAIPVYGELGPQPPRVVIPLQGSTPIYLAQSGRQLSISFDPNDIPAIDLHTHLARISTEISKILMDLKTPNKAGALRPVYDELQRLRPQAEQASSALQAQFDELQKQLGKFLASTNLQIRLLVSSSSSSSSSSSNNNNNNNNVVNGSLPGKYTYN